MSTKITRREFVTTALAGAALAAAGSPSFSQSNKSRPNILFILADDLGYADLSCYGRPDYETPNLDSLARQGVRFSNAYSASPLCTPTRCAFITGRYPARTRVGLEEPLHERRALGDKALTLGLPPEHPTIASLLKKSGYETALVGKWHLGYLPNFGPIQSGFDEFFGIMSGAADFFTHKDMEGDGDLFEGKVPVERIGYMTDMLTQRAVEYLEKRAVNKVGRGQRRRSGAGEGNSQPFYLSLHYTAPHWPWEGPGDRAPSPELRGPVAFRGGGSLKKYAEMMKSLDDGIGKVLTTLAHSGLDQNTLVIFTSDNGGERFSYNWPFKGEKNSLWEGGIRIPAIVRLPAVQKSKVQGPRSNVGADPGTEPGATATGSQLESNVQGPTSKVGTGLGTEPGAIATGSDADSNPRWVTEYAHAMKSVPVAPPVTPSGRILDLPIITMDWTATILAAANARPDPNYPLDGIDLIPFISSSISHPPSSISVRTFFWRNANQDAAVRSPWKYLNDGTREYLFNLSMDQHEQADFREQNPAIFNELKAAYKAWESTVLPRPPARSKQIS